MGIRFIVLVISFISVCFGNLYAEANAHKQITFDVVIENVNHKVRRTKNCDELDKYLDLLVGLKKQDLLSDKQEQRVEVILQNRC